MIDRGHTPLSQALAAGDAALAREDWHQALSCGKTATALAPTHAGSRSLLGLALLHLGETDKAIGELEQAAQLARNNAALLGNLAQAYALAKRHVDAGQTFRRAQRLAPGHWPYAQGAAIALAEQGAAVQAEGLLQRLTEQHPGEPMLWHNLAHLQLEALGLAQLAEQNFRRALHLDPADADSLAGLGLALHRQSRFPEAIAAYRAGIAAHPQWPVPRLNLVSALIDDGRFAEAESECRVLVGLAPDWAEAHRFLGAACGHQGRLPQAAAAFRRAAECAPEDPSNQRSLGGALAECGQLHAGLRALARTDVLLPDAVETLQLRSMVDLAHGRFSDGWRAYASRPAYSRRAEEWQQAGVVQSLPERLEGLHVLVRREQGLGDELFFLRQLPLLKVRGARITVLASPKITPMIARSGIADAVLPEDAGVPAGVDLQILCGDLPLALLQCAATSLPPRTTQCPLPDHAMLIGAYFPKPAGTLRIPPLPEAVQRMRNRLQSLGPPPYIGLTWRAGTAVHAQQGADWVLSKNLGLPLLGEAVRQARGTLIALQRHPAPGEIDALASICGRPVADLSGLNEQLEDMLALLELLDDYVGVSNTNMHLRAAAGRTGRVLVPSPAEWRWMHWGSESPWFPGFRIYRQALSGDWSAALELLGRDLAAR
jgi:Flp pilus assembly protein TadD